MGAGELVNLGKPAQASPPTASTLASMI